MKDVRITIDRGSDPLQLWADLIEHQRLYFGIGIDRRHVGTVVQRVIQTDNSKVRRIP